MKYKSIKLKAKIKKITKYIPLIVSNVATENEVTKCDCRNVHSEKSGDICGNCNRVYN